MEFGISCKTGYKIFDRYQQCGIHGLTDRSRRPYRYANQLPFQVENHILNVKHEHSSWGARKIRERLIRRFSGIPIPAKSTTHAVLDRGCGQLASDASLHVGNLHPDRVEKRGGLDLRSTSR
jgi:putative transposase